MSTLHGRRKVNLKSKTPKRVLFRFRFRVALPGSEWTAAPSAKLMPPKLGLVGKRLPDLNWSFRGVTTLSLPSLCVSELLHIAHVLSDSRFSSIMTPSLPKEALCTLSPQSHSRLAAPFHWPRHSPHQCSKPEIETKGCVKMRVLEGF